MKKGTLVQISPNIRGGVNGVVSSMLKYAGKIAKVTTSGKFVKLDISSDDWDWSWHELDLIPIELLVGDTVKIADDIEVGKHGVIFDMEKYAGQITKIIKVSDNYGDIRLEIKTRYCWHYNDLIKMDEKYKPGDKVTIVSNLEVDGKGITPEMLQYAGKKATIVKTSHGFCHLDVDSSKWWWHPDLLTNCNIITLDSIIQIGNIVSAFVGREKDFLKNDIVEIRSNRSAVKLRDWDKWIPIQQIHADVKMLAEKISADNKLYYQSPYLGRIELIEYDSSKEYPLLIKTSDGDEFELTFEGKLFKDSQISVL